MKKLIVSLLTVLLLAGAVACQPQAPADANVSGTLAEIMEKIYAGANLKEPPQFVETDIAREDTQYFFGVENMEYKEALASEPMISAIPHSVCLVRLNEGQDVEAVKQSIKENANPRKWICVGVEENQVVVDSIGDLVVLIMSADAEALHDSFLTLKDK